jgi:hypothetical protein
MAVYGLRWVRTMLKASFPIRVRLFYGLHLQLYRYHYHFQTFTTKVNTGFNTCPSRLEAVDIGLPVRNITQYTLPFAFTY